MLVIYVMLIGFLLVIETHPIILENKTMIDLRLTSTNYTYFLVFIETIIELAGTSVQQKLSLN